MSPTTEALGFSGELVFTVVEYKKLALKVGALYEKATRSAFSQNILWVTGLSGVERLVAVIQTVLLARTLGIVEYGAYGLLFGTIGFVASLIGLQMGLTGTVHIARFRENDKAKVAHVIQHVTCFALIISFLFMCLTIPFAKEISGWLFVSDQYTLAVVIGCALVVASILSGVQDGILQGFEDFRSVAKVRIVTSVLTLAAIYPAALFVGLPGAMGVLLGGILVKYLALTRMVKSHRQNNDIPLRGAGVSFTDLIVNFSAPTMLVSLMVGAVTWFGTFWLSRQPGGFEAVAIINTGLQWRGPILLLAASIGSVAVPVFSRFAGSRNTDGSNRLAKKLLWVNGIAAISISLVLISASKFVLAMYGEEFTSGQLAFALLVLTSVPQLMANVFMQQLVGSGRVWLQFWLHVPFVLILGFGFLLLIPAYMGVGYAWSMLIGTFGFLLVSGSFICIKKVTV